MTLQQKNESTNATTTEVEALNDQDFAQEIKSDYQAAFTTIKTAFLEDAKTSALFKSHCKLVDGLLKRVWQHCQIDASCSLIAVGGYGRGELYPYSDLDLLILLPKDKDQANKALQNIERMIGLFWDVGLNVGHSVRTVAECEEEAKKDISTQTNLIECRFITGEYALFTTYIQSVAATLQVEPFIKAKVLEQKQRYAKYNDTAYNLEPNIKESPGGLRDIHSILWITRSYLIGHTVKNNTSLSIDALFKQQDQFLWSWLKKEQIISVSELRHLQNNQRVLQTIRTYLHFVSGRREDRLLFDFQNEVANVMGFESSGQKRSSEKLMQRYFRSVKSIQVINEILIKTIQDYTNVVAPNFQKINARFSAVNGLLIAAKPDLFQEQSETIFEAFSLLQHEAVNGLSASLLRQLLRVRKVMDNDFIHSQQNKKQFIKILSQKTGVSDTVRAMNRYGVLGGYIPAFRKVVGQMQHDLFHVYTVDEHTMHVLSNVHRFTDNDYSYEFPLCSELIAAFDKPHLLYLAAIFHDIAKGRNGDHSELGKVDAKDFCEQHGLAKEDTMLVSWLVESHLKMSSTAQKCDLSDPQVVNEFASLVQNERRLVALYLLTVSDIRGTSPKVWNAWKASLLESLFKATRGALKTEQKHAKEVIDSRQQEAVERLTKMGLKPESFTTLWDQFGSDYLERHQIDEIIWHSRLLTPHLYTKEPIVRSHLSASGEGLQVMVYEKVQKDIFAIICNFFDRMGYSIAEAKIYTTDHGYALDTFIVLIEHDNAVSYDGLNQYIETELTKKLAHEGPIDTPLEGRISRQIKHVDFETKVEITQLDEHFHQLLIVTADTPSLLAKLAHLFLLQEINLHNAKIYTLGNRVEDTMIISGKNDRQLTKAQISKLKQELLDIL